MPDLGLIHRVVAIVYPSDFLTRNGEDLRRSLEEDFREAEQLGGIRGVALKLRSASDLFWGGILERIRSIRGLDRPHPGTSPPGPRNPWKESAVRSFLHDFRYALRSLRKSPVFTSVAVVTLGLGIGANTTIFSVVNGVLLQPLPYEDSDRLANIWNDLGNGAQSLPAVHALDFRDYQEWSETFEEFAAGSGGVLVGASGILTGEGQPEQVEVSPVTHNFFSMLGVDPEMGRHFTELEEAPNGPAVALINHSLWQRRFGGDPDIVGRTFTMDGRDYEVVGVMPRGFRLYLPDEAFLIRDSEVWLPLQFDYADAPPRNFTAFTVFGKIREGVTWEQAQQEMDDIAARLRAEHEVHTASNLQIRVVPLQTDVVKGTETALLVLLGAVGLVLLIACANVANLLLTRATARSQELAIHAAMGASGGRLLGRLLTESALLALGGAALGLVLTWASLEALHALQPPGLPRLQDIGVDPTVLAFTVGATLAATLLFGIFPGLKASRLDPGSVLRDGGRALGGRTGFQRRILVVAEVSLSLVLLVGTGLMLRSFAALQQVDAGFQAEGVLTFRLSFPRGTYPDGDSREAFTGELRARLLEQPGVRAVGFTSQLPLTGSGPLQPYAYNEETARNWESVTADERGVDPAYFEVVGTRLLEGRPFTDLDARSEEEVIIVDETLAARAWPQGEAVGRLLQIEPTGSDDPFARVVGVVEHVRLHDLSRETLPQIYRPEIGRDRRSDFVVRTSGDPSQLAGTVRSLVRDLDPDLPINALRPLTDYVSDATGRARFSLILMSLFGISAGLLAAVGIYGVMAFAVSARRQEIGVRMALGEAPGSVRNRVLFESVKLVAVSLVIGLAGAAVLARAAETLLYGVDPIDPVTYGTIAGLMGVVAIAAAYLPARRATRIDPVEALRAE